MLNLALRVSGSFLTMFSLYSAKVLKEPCLAALAVADRTCVVAGARTLIAVEKSLVCVVSMLCCVTLFCLFVS